jgi:hypothetical protein
MNPTRFDLPRCPLAGQNDAVGFISGTPNSGPPSDNPEVTYDLIVPEKISPQQDVQYAGPERVRAIASA